MGTDPLLGGYWDIYLPVVLIVLCLGNLFDLYSKIAEMFANASKLRVCFIRIN